MPAVGRTILGSVLLLVGALLAAGESVLGVNENRPFWTHFISWNTYVAVGVSTFGITYLWWYRNARLCDHGYVVRHELLKWASCRRWYWDAVYRDVLVLDADRKVALKV